MTQPLQTILFFDLDGTVMVNPFGSVVFPILSRKIAAAAGLSPDAVFAEIMREHDNRLDHPLADRARTMDWKDILQTVAARHGVEFTDSAEALVIDHAAPPHTAAIDNAPEVLRRLRDGGKRKLVVASMGLSKYQLPVLKALNLHPYFDDFLMPDTTGFLKTDRGFYTKYLEAAALRIHVGDRYDHDCLLPKQWGGLAVLRLPLLELEAASPFERPQHIAAFQDQISGVRDEMSVLPDAVVVALAELPDVIEKLEMR